MNNINYQRELDKILMQMEAAGREWKPQRTEEGVSLFLHSCCAPCSSYVLEYLSSYFEITVFYYNPNIGDREEYSRRMEEQKRLIQVLNEEGGRYRIQWQEGGYEPECFYSMARGLENCQEGGVRCFGCYELRLRETAKRAEAAKTEYFATTLTVSPLKNAGKLNEIGESLSAEYHVRWLPSDFKKKDGYKRSVELSQKYGLYRQDYCGCEFSRRDREASRAGS